MVGGGLKVIEELEQEQEQEQELVLTQRDSDYSISSLNILEHTYIVETGYFENVSNL